MNVLAISFFVSTSQAVNRKSIVAPLSLHITSRIESDIDERRHEQRTRRATTHKEEMKGNMNRERGEQRLTTER